MPKYRVHLLVLYIATAAITAAVLAWPTAGFAEARPATTAKTKQYQVKVLERQVSKSESTIAFWNGRGQWALHRRYAMCWQVHGKQRRKVCRKARESLRHHTHRLEVASARLEKLTMIVGNREHWECIYSHERGADGWQTNTGNGYYGGLQMDRDFQRAHGLDLYLAKGTANNWTELEQMMVAERAKRGVRTSLDGGRVYLWQDRARGYNPWPNTARTCGLLY